MKCPHCDNTIRFDWLELECIEGKDEFECPSCQVELIYIEDESDSLYHRNARRVDVVALSALSQAPYWTNTRYLLSSNSDCSLCRSSDCTEEISIGVVVLRLTINHCSLGTCV